MFGDEQKVPAKDQDTPKANDTPPAKPQDDDTKGAYRFTDWAQI